MVHAIVLGSLFVAVGCANVIAELDALEEQEHELVSQVAALVDQPNQSADGGGRAAGGGAPYVVTGEEKWMKRFSFAPIVDEEHKVGQSTCAARTQPQSG
jgi:outer membrane murein-binding lipoprotein Lpp